MATMTANATANIIAQGDIQAAGSIAWTRPNIPSGSTITSITISGMYSWTGKGTSTISINGSTVTADTSFNIELVATTTSPLTITCVGNKAAIGANFTWTNLIVTYTYEILTKYYNVTVGIIVNGTVTVNPNGNVEESILVTITATPDSGYQIVDYFVNGTSIGQNSFNVTGDSIVTVTFEKISGADYLTVKDNDSLINIREVYKIVNGELVRQPNLKDAFDTNMNYKYIYVSPPTPPQPEIPQFKFYNGVISNSIDNATITCTGENNFTFSTDKTNKNVYFDVLSGQAGNPKTFNTYNKLFTLKKGDKITIYTSGSIQFIVKCNLYTFKNNTTSLINTDNSSIAILNEDTDIYGICCHVTTLISSNKLVSQNFKINLLINDIRWL